MLFNREIIRAVAYRLKSVKAPVVVDPVMISTSGAVLLEKSAIRELLVTLLPLATLVTPNLSWTPEFLLKRRIHDPEQMRAAARELNSSYHCAVLVKGGHLKGAKTAVDVFYDGGSELLLEAPFIEGVSTHEPAAPIPPPSPPIWPWKGFEGSSHQRKEFISNAIASSWRCGKHDVLNSFWKNSCG